QGKPKGIFALGEDVTEQQSINAALRESEERYRRLVEGMPLGIYRSTPDGKLIFCNPICARLFGVNSPAEAMHINLETYPFGSKYARKEFRERLEREEQIRGQESEWMLPDGTIR